ncbi:MAG: ATP-dependent DNA ligase, partial [Candidatus Hodarchaeales archaeon]
MIISSYERSAIETDEAFSNLIAEIKQVTNLKTFDITSYFKLANSYQLPLHIVYLIIHAFKKGEKLSLTELSSASFYAICRDILTPYKNKAFTFHKLFNLKYPFLKNTDERLVWYLTHDNGLSLIQKVSVLEGETSFNRMGIGRTRFEQVLRRINIEATHLEVEKRRLGESYGEWPAAVSTFIKKERGDLTLAEVLAVGDALAEDSRITIKIAVLAELVKRMGKIEVYFLASQINRFHDHVSRTSSLVRAFSQAFKIDYKMLERLISMHSFTDIADLVQNNKVLEQFERLLPFRPFKPMLAAKWEKSSSFPVYAEAKYDGVRLLVHKLGNRIGCYSRRRREYTYKYTVINRLLHIIPAYSVILDGEITAQQWTVEGPRYLNVYELHEAVKHGLESVQLIYVIFDVLFLNGVETVHLPYEQRRQIRHQIVAGMKA